MKPFGHPPEADGILHWIVTDSGIGGLSICAEIEQALRLSGGHPPIRITYFNAWPEQGVGYNSLPDVQARATAFHRALTRMGRLGPDRILIACNTLSILFGMTEFSRTTLVPVAGIIDAGVALFYEGLHADPRASLVILGTRTTIESQIHRDQLVAQGIRDTRIRGIACHGLAAAIEKDPESPAVAAAIEQCVCEADPSASPGGPWLVGLACTHYGYVSELIRRAFEPRCGPRVRILDPNRRLAETVVASILRNRHGGVPVANAIPVTVVSKVELYEDQRRAVARQIEPVSRITARALMNYTHQSDLF
jgi:glutamate racemase